MRRLVAEPAPWAPRCVLAESPRWYDDRWWWVDAPRGLVFTARPAGPTVGAAHQWASLGTRVPLVHPAARAGAMLVADGSVLRFYRDGSPEPGADAGESDDAKSAVPVGVVGTAVPGPVLAEFRLPPGWLLNDGGAGPAGGFYVGVVDPARSPGSGYLQYIRPDGSFGGRIEGIGLSNGVALDPAGSMLYHADSTEHVVWVHRLADGDQIVGSAVHLRFDAAQGMPDGLAVDVAGGLWVACYGTGEVRRYTPAGDLDLVVEVPTAQVTSVGLGGPDGHDLLVTTAREGFDDRRSAAEPMAGRLFTARSPYRGRALVPVGGPTG